MQFKYMIACISALAILSGCSDNDGGTVKSPDQKPTRTMTPDEVAKEKARRVYNPTPEERAQDQAEREKEEAKLREKDPVTWNLERPGEAPDFGAYKLVTSGTQLVYIYNGNKKEGRDDSMSIAKSFGYRPTHYELGDPQLMELLEKFAQTNDQFEQRDIAQMLDPVIEKHVAENKNTRYVRVQLPSTLHLSAYNFEKKGFSYEPGFFNAVSKMSSSEQSKSYARGNQIKDRGDLKFGDNPAYTMTFSNGPDFQFIPVEDEASARVLESYVQKNKPYTVTAYGYVDSLTQGDNEKADSRRATIVTVQKLVVADKGNPDLVLAVLSK